MRFASVRSPSGTYAARIEGAVAVRLPFSDVGAMLAAGAGAAAGGAEAPGEQANLAELDLAPVVADPSRIVCVGLNYRAHILEMKRQLPEYPTLFAKFAAALIGPKDAIRMPRESARMDWEAELAVVVGRAGRHLSEEEALEAIAGYAVVNDVTARDFQNRTPQWLQGKTFEGTCPLGPVLVTPEEVDHARDLEITCEVDGKVVQQARTSDLLFSPAALVSYVSRLFTLRPGDVVCTGTPGGVGAGMDPPTFLRDGSVVRTAIEGIGELVNTCVSEPL